MDNIWRVDQSQWETTRALGYIIAQTHADRRKKLTPQKLMPFPWDSEESGQRERISENEKKRYDEMWKKEEERIKKFMKQK